MRGFRGLDQEREERDRRIEEAATDYFIAEEARTGLLRQVEAVEAEMAASVGALRELGESNARIAALLDLDAKDVRRILTASTPQLAAAPDRDGDREPSAVHHDAAVPSVV